MTLWLSLFHHDSWEDPYLRCYSPYAILLFGMTWLCGSGNHWNFSTVLADVIVTLFCYNELYFRILGDNGVSCQSAKTPIRYYLLAGDRLCNCLDNNWLYWFSSVKRVENQISPWLWLCIFMINVRTIAKLSTFCPGNGRYLRKNCMFLSSVLSERGTNPFFPWSRSACDRNSKMWYFLGY